MGYGRVSLIGSILNELLHSSKTPMHRTLVDSTAGVEGAWATFKEKYPSLDIEQILRSALILVVHVTSFDVIPAAHGVRTVENLRKYIPSLTEEEVNVCATLLSLPFIHPPPYLV